MPPPVSLINNKRKVSLICSTNYLKAVSTLRIHNGNNIYKM